MALEWTFHTCMTLSDPLSVGTKNLWCTASFASLQKTCHPTRCPFCGSTKACLHPLALLGGRADCTPLTRSTYCLLVVAKFLLLRLESSVMTTGVNRRAFATQSAIDPLPPDTIVEKATAETTRTHQRIAIQFTSAHSHGVRQRLGRCALLGTSFVI